jgi:hypothetical protein
MHAEIEKGMFKVQNIANPEERSDIPFENLVYDVFT